MRTPVPLPRWTAAELRRDLNARAAELARTQGLLHDVAPGSDAAVVFGSDEEARHGNFHPAAYAAICARGNGRGG
jgi:hypothetical protein